MIDKTYIEQIRFLPMSAKEFDTFDKVTTFLLNDLIERDGKYWYIRRNICINKNAFVLFQYSGQLIACALMIEQGKMPKTENYITYQGYYKFDVKSIRVFTTPITCSQYREIDNTFMNFNQSSRKTSMNLYDKVIELVYSHL